MWTEVHKVTDMSPDLLVAFRPMNLLPDMLVHLRKHMLTSVWLSDDPVLYKVCYGDVAPHFDFLLHCGSEKVISFYKSQGHSHGVNFPFWTDHHAFPPIYEPESANTDVIFLGNMNGQVRRKRYAEVAAMPFNTRVYGLLDSDPAALHGGFVKDAYLHCNLISAILKKGRVGLSIPQFFTEYKGLHYDFPLLDQLGYFQFPSRVIQYAASGLPVAAVGDNDMKVFPELNIQNSVSSLVPYINQICGNIDFAKAESQAVLRRFQRNYSALSRAQMLLSLAENFRSVCKMSSATRACLFTDFSVDYKVDTY